MSNISHHGRSQGLHDGLKAELDGGTDRGLVLTCASALEAGLEELLSSFLIDHTMTRDLLRSPGMPLNGLANRISMAFALGLIIPSDRFALEIIRDIGCEAASGERFEINRSEHVTRIRDAYGRVDTENGDAADRDKLFHITTVCLSNLHRASGSADKNRSRIRKSYDGSVETAART